MTLRMEATSKQWIQNLRDCITILQTGPMTDHNNHNNLVLVLCNISFCEFVDELWSWSMIIQGHLNQWKSTFNKECIHVVLFTTTYKEL